LEQSDNSTQAFLPVQNGKHVPAWQMAPPAQGTPQVPPQPSSPQTLPAHVGMQGGDRFFLFLFFLLRFFLALP
jgi:hypothetical protein